MKYKLKNSYCSLGYDILHTEQTVYPPLHFYGLFLGADYYKKGDDKLMYKVKYKLKIKMKGKIKNENENNNTQK